ncbi:hypothetical protein CTAYLR_001936 [Chrysophaeum taylorii]|uniref:histidine kinase n=1 Tax=Chrysophaeum taylorii TaxID=2483200 RepID=A0AAD7U8H2_9STRA|nr:hypothetical protein CTAYLR_001936 [Chrysophaeum taylorii]
MAMCCFKPEPGDSSASCQQIPMFRGMLQHLSRVRYSLFVYDDDVVKALLTSVFEKAAFLSGTTTTSVVFTYDPPGQKMQYFLAWYGTLVLDEENCDKCDAVCPLNPTPGDALVIRDLTTDERTRGSKLVTGPPRLTSYAGVRIADDLSIIVLYSCRAASLASLGRARDALTIVANVIPSLLSAKENDDDQKMRMVVDRTGVVVRTTKACERYLERTDIVGRAPDGLAVDPSSLRSLLVAPNAGSCAVVEWQSGKKAEVTVELCRRVRVLNVVDVTDARELVKKRKELEVQRKVLSQFAHELRNKFTASAAVLDHVYERLDGIELGNLKTEVSAAKLMLDEANQLIHTRLSLYKMFKQTYDATANLQVVDLKEWLGSLAAKARLQVADGVELRVACDATTAVELDFYVANHVFQNLLNNSSKYTKRGYIEIAVRSVSATDITLSLYDTGHGIPEAAREYLFESDVISADARGTGLGLSSCGLFLRAINGEIWLESSTVTTLSQSGRTDIRFRMPCRPVNNPNKRKEPSDPNLPLPLVAEVHVIEDSDLIRKMIVRKFATAFKDATVPPKFKEYNTVEEALEAMREHPPGPDSLVSVDENLQSKGGFLSGGAMISFLTQRNYRGLIVSASGDDGASKKHIDLGAHCSLGKPFPKSLRPTLEDGFKRRLAASADDAFEPGPPSVVCVLREPQQHHVTRQPTTTTTTTTSWRRG